MKNIITHNKDIAFDSGPISSLLTLQDGFLHIKAKISRLGVMDYNGTPKVKLPKNLFSKSTLQSFVGKPVTDEHPVSQNSIIMLDSANYNLFVKGVINSVSPEENFLAASITIWDQDLIQKIKNGKRNVSIGYFKLDVRQNGIWENQPYSIIQTNIHGNHLAVTNKGRAGEVVSIELDSNKLPKSTPSENPQSQIDSLSKSLEFNKQKLKNFQLNFHSSLNQLLEIRENARSLNINFNSNDPVKLKKSIIHNSLNIQTDSLSNPEIDAFYKAALLLESKKIKNPYPPNLPILQNSSQIDCQRKYSLSKLTN